MRQPKAWNDKTVLKQEPFATAFHDHAATKSNRRKHVEWKDSTVDDLKKAKGGRQTVKVWLKHVLRRSQCEEKPKTVTIDRGAQLFVSVFWLLYQGDEYKASTIVNNFRNECGLWYNLGEGPEPDHPSAEASPSVISTTIEERSDSNDLSVAKDGQQSCLLPSQNPCATVPVASEKGDLASLLDAAHAERRDYGAVNGGSSAPMPPFEAQETNFIKYQIDSLSPLTSLDSEDEDDHRTPHFPPQTSDAPASLAHTSSASRPDADISLRRGQPRQATNRARIAQMAAADDRFRRKGAVLADGDILSTPDPAPKPKKTIKKPAIARQPGDMASKQQTNQDRAIEPLSKTGYPRHLKDDGGKAVQMPQVGKRSKRSLPVAPRLREAQPDVNPVSLESPVFKAPAKKLATKKPARWRTSGNEPPVPQGSSARESLPSDIPSPQTISASRRGQTRKAANTGRLSEMMAAETRFQKGDMSIDPVNIHEKSVHETARPGDGLWDPSPRPSSISTARKSNFPIDAQVGKRSRPLPAPGVSQASAHPVNFNERSVRKTTGPGSGAQNPYTQPSSISTARKSTFAIDAQVGKRSRPLPIRGVDHAESQDGASDRKRRRTQIATPNTHVSDATNVDKSSNGSRKRRKIHHDSSGEVNVANPPEEHGLPSATVREEPVRAAKHDIFSATSVPPRHSGGSLALSSYIRTSTVVSVNDEPPTIDATRSSLPTMPAGSGAQSVILSPEPRVRPKLPKYPPIWALSRQELCESFEWFRSYQGGVYFTGDIAKGYLLGGFSSARDLWHHDGKLIISHGGGKAESVHSHKGHSVVQEAGDQLESDKSVRALLRNYSTRRPLVLIADDRYALFPYDLASDNYTYVVLGYYIITQAWAEYQMASNSRGRVVRFKFCFQWCSSQGEPWWQRLHEPSLETAPPLEGATNQTLPALQYFIETSGYPTIYQGQMADLEACAQCHNPSPRIYGHGWMCLNSTCPAFWTLKNGIQPPAVLNYAESFLSLRSLESYNLPDLRPEPPVLIAEDGVITSRPFTRGWHCKKCGRLSSRYKWEHWECANCGATLKVNGRVRLPRELWTKPAVKFEHNWIAIDSGIQRTAPVYHAGSSGSGYYQTFYLPNNCGRIHHFMGNPRANSRANEIFREYQEQAMAGILNFRRWPIRSHKCRGQLLSNYFSHNAGAPYQYVGGSNNTVPFEAAPSAVLHALDLVQERASVVLGGRSQFNEILSAAYMQDQQMAFHSDDEKGLGPNVASLSLGAPAVMHFRLHGQTHAPKDRNTKFVMSIILQHGDVVVMEGAGIQKYYEHKVVPEDFRIVATARFIDTTQNVLSQ